MVKPNKYLFWFAQDFLSLDLKLFREAEISSLAKLFNVNFKILNNHSDAKPFWIVECDENEDKLKTMINRSFTMKYALRLWLHADSTEKFHTNLKNLTNDKQIPTRTDSFKVTVESFNKKLSLKEKVEKIETLDYLPLDGPIDLRNPDFELVYIEYYGMLQNQPYDVPEVIFGEKFAKGSRTLITDLSLKSRKFIGNTSMDPQLAFLMINQALVRRGSFVFDPFVGSGSILVSAAKLGCYVMGADIDYLMLHGKSKPTRKYATIRAVDEGIVANLKQYDCQQFYIDSLVNDFSLPTWRPDVVFDAIITDPPYGLREAIEQIKFKDKTVNDSSEIHYPSTSKYNLSVLYLDLLNFAVKHLKMDGRLVMWYPVVIDENGSRDFEVPKHKSLTLVSSTPQLLSQTTGRLLVTYEKVGDELEREPSVIVQNIRETIFSNRDEKRKLKQSKHEHNKNYLK